MELLAAAFIAFFISLLTLQEEALHAIIPYDIFNIIDDYSISTITIFSIIILGVIFILKNCFIAFEIYYQHYVAGMMNYTFGKKLLHHITQHNYLYIIKHNTSYFREILQADCLNVFQTGTIALATLLSEGLIISAFIAFIIVKNPYFAIILFIFIAITACIMFIYVMPKFQQWGKIIQQQGINANASLLQFLYGFKEVIIRQKKRFFIDNYGHASLTLNRVRAITQTAHHYPRLFLETSIILIFIMLLAFTYNNTNHNDMVIATIGSYVYIGFRFAPSLNRIIIKFNTLKQITPSLNRLYQEYRLEKPAHIIQDIPEFSFKDSIYFHDVSFTYDDNQMILHNINITIQKNDIIGVVGQTGSGKSTFINLLMGLLQPYHGHINIDKKFAVHSKQWQERIGYVAQSPYLLDASFAANIAFGEDNIDYKRVEELIDHVKLRDVINYHEQGIQTIIGENGVRLSGGECQRLAIARALYHQPEILIFDEATSALDNDTETQIIDMIYQLKSYYTIVMIAHRLSTLHKCDYILNAKDKNIIKTSLSDL